MTYSQPARPTTHRIRVRRIRTAGLVVAIVAIAAVLGYRSLASSASTVASRIDVHRSEHRAAFGEAAGAVPDGTTVFDDEIPGVANLDSDLLGALRQAATDGVGSSTSTAAGGPRSTRNDSSTRRSRSTARKQRLPDGSPPPTRPLTCRATRSTSAPPMPRRGCPSTAPGTGYARSTATSPGTTSCAPKRSITVALPCTPTLRTIQGCSSDDTLGLVRAAIGSSRRMSARPGRHGRSGARSRRGAARSRGSDVG